MGRASKRTSISSWPADTPATVKLADFIRFHVVRLLDPSKPAWHTRLIMRELTQPSAACTELVRDYIEPKSRILGGILEELLPSGTPRQQRFMTAFSIMGQILFYCTHKPIVLLLLGDKDQPYEDTAALAEHITRFTMRALNADKATTTNHTNHTNKREKNGKLS